MDFSLRGYSSYPPIPDPWFVLFHTRTIHFATVNRLFSMPLFGFNYFFATDLSDALRAKRPDSRDKRQSDDFFLLLSKVDTEEEY